MAKCKICMNQVTKGQTSGLCPKHHSQYNRQRETEGRNLKEFVALHTMNVSKDKDKFEKIDVENAKEQKMFWQAMKEQEHALRAKRDNKLRDGLIVDKSEAMKENALILSAILKDFESLTDILPPILEHKSAGEIRGLIVEQMDLTFAGIRGRLDELQK